MPEPPDPRLVYAKTPAGVQAITERAETLTPPARRLLLLIDGRRPIAALPAALRPGELPRLIADLQAAGLIVPTGTVEGLQADGAPRDPRLEDFKRRIAGVVRRELGPAGSVLEARLQDCVNATVMRGVLREVIDLVRARAGGPAASRVAAAARAASRAWTGPGDAGAPPLDAGSPPAAAAGQKGRPPGRA